MWLWDEERSHGLWLLFLLIIGVVKWLEVFQRYNEMVRGISFQMV